MRCAFQLRQMERHNIRIWYGSRDSYIPNTLDSELPGKLIRINLVTTANDQESIPGSVWTMIVLVHDFLMICMQDNTFSVGSADDLGSGNHARKIKLFHVNLNQNYDENRILDKRSWIGTSHRHRLI